MNLPLDWMSGLRLGLLFAHLLACVFALHDVLQADWRLLWGRLAREDLAAVRLRVHRSLIALWLTGLAVVAIDLGGTPAMLAAKPKIAAKLVVVLALTLNGIVLNRQAFPLLASGVRLSRARLRWVMGCGALSSSSWLFAAFLGLARPLAQVPLPELLQLYLWVAGTAVASGLLLGRTLAERGWAGLGHALVWPARPWRARPAIPPAAAHLTHDSLNGDSPPQQLAA